MQNLIIITDQQQLETIVKQAVAQALQPITSNATQGKPNKKWLTSKEVMDTLNCSARTLQHLRDTRQIEFSQHARKIMYPADGIEQFLQKNTVKTRRY